MAATAGAISIGRNVKDKPLSAEQWARFVGEVQNAVETAGGVIYATAYGRGEWQGIAEDNCVITFGGVHDGVGFRTVLRWIAQDYQQDAIALLVGESVLIESGVAA